MRPERRSFTEQEDDYLRAHYLTGTNRDIAAVLGRTEGAVRHRLSQLNLLRWRTKPFSAAEDEVIRASAGRSSVDVGRQLGRAPAVIRLRARRLGLPYSWKDFGGGLKEYRGYKVGRIERGDGDKSRRVPEHRCVMESHLGRPLLDSERVHHINARKRDNRPENLYVCANTAAHSRAHHSLNDLVAELLDREIICFNRAKGIYELCEISK